MEKNKLNRAIAISLTVFVLIAAYGLLIYPRYLEYKADVLMMENYEQAKVIFRDNELLFRESAELIDSCILRSGNKINYWRVDVPRAELPIEKIVGLDDATVAKLRELFDVIGTGYLGVHQNNAGDMVFCIIDDGRLNYIEIILRYDEQKSNYFAFKKELLADDWMLIWSVYPRV